MLFVFQNVSVWTLGNLVGSGEKTWLVLHSQGFLAKLLKLIEGGDVIADSQLRTDINENSFNALVQFLRVGSKLLTYVHFALKTTWQISVNHINKRNWQNFSVYNYNNSLKSIKKQINKWCDYSLLIASSKLKKIF